MITHELKTDPEAFGGALKGHKNFEIRFDDRGFLVGDILELKETKFSGEKMRAGKPLVYTGRTITMFIHYILRGPVYGLKEGWVIIS